MAKGNSENERLSGKCRLGGGRGRVNPPPCGLVLRFWRFGGFWFEASTRLEAQGLGGMINIWATFVEVQLGGHGAEKSEPNEQKSDRSETCHQNRPDRSR